MFKLDEPPAKGFDKCRERGVPNVEFHRRSSASMPYKPEPFMSFGAQPIRSAQTAVYALLGLNREPPSVYQGPARPL
jgi:hypothetical protein